MSESNRPRRDLSPIKKESIFTKRFNDLSGLSSYFIDKITPEFLRKDSGEKKPTRRLSLNGRQENFFQKTDTVHLEHERALKDLVAEYSSKSPDYFANNEEEMEKATRLANKFFADLDKTVKEASKKTAEEIEDIQRRAVEAIHHADLNAAQYAQAILRLKELAKSADEYPRVFGRIIKKITTALPTEWGTKTKDFVATPKTQKQRREHWLLKAKMLEAKSNFGGVIDYTEPASATFVDEEKKIPGGYFGVTDESMFAVQKELQALGAFLQTKGAKITGLKDRGSSPTFEKMRAYDTHSETISALVKRISELRGKIEKFIKSLPNRADPKDQQKLAKYTNRLEEIKTEVVSKINNIKKSASIPEEMLAKIQTALSTEFGIQEKIVDEKPKPATPAKEVKKEITPQSPEEIKKELKKKEEEKEQEKLALEIEEDYQDKKRFLVAEQSGLLAIVAGEKDRDSKKDEKFFKDEVLSMVEAVYEHAKNRGETTDKEKNFGKKLDNAFASLYLKLLRHYRREGLISPTELQYGLGRASWHVDAETQAEIDKTDIAPIVEKKEGKINPLPKNLAEVAELYQDVRGTYKEAEFKKKVRAAFLDALTDQGVNTTAYWHSVGMGHYIEDYKKEALATKTEIGMDIEMDTPEMKTLRPVFGEVVDKIFPEDLGRLLALTKENFRGKTPEQKNLLKDLIANQLILIKPEATNPIKELEQILARATYLASLPEQAPAQSAEETTKQKGKQKQQNNRAEPRTLTANEFSIPISSSLISLKTWGEAQNSSYEEENYVQIILTDYAGYTAHTNKEVPLHTIPSQRNTIKTMAELQATPMFRAEDPINEEEKKIKTVEDVNGLTGEQLDEILQKHNFVANPTGNSAEARLRQRLTERKAQHCFLATTILEEKLNQIQVYSLEILLTILGYDDGTKGAQNKLKEIKAKAVHKVVRETMTEVTLKPEDPGNIALILEKVYSDLIELITQKRDEVTKNEEDDVKTLLATIREQMGLPALTSPAKPSEKPSPVISDDLPELREDDEESVIAYKILTLKKDIANHNFYNFKYNLNQSTTRQALKIIREEIEKSSNQSELAKLKAHVHEAMNYFSEMENKATLWTEAGMKDWYEEMYGPIPAGPTETTTPGDPNLTEEGVADLLQAIKKLELDELSSVDEADDDFDIEKTPGVLATEELELSPEEDERLTNIITKYLLYLDKVPRNKEVLLRGTRDPDTGKMLDNYRHYASTLAELLEKHPTELKKVGSEIRDYFEATMKQIKLDKHRGGYSDSDSWIYWDIAKQAYLSKNPSQSDPDKYVLGNPLEDSEVAKTVRQAIVDRHLGWELSGKYERYALDHLKINGPHYDEISNLINSDNRYTSGSLSSDKLTLLGKLLRENLGIPPMVSEEEFLEPQILSEEPHDRTPVPVLETVNPEEQEALNQAYTYLDTLADEIEGPSLSNDIKPKVLISCAQTLKNTFGESIAQQTQAQWQEINRYFARLNGTGLFFGINKANESEEGLDAFKTTTEEVVYLRELDEEERDEVLGEAALYGQDLFAWASSNDALVTIPGYNTESKERVVLAQLTRKFVRDLIKSDTQEGIPKESFKLVVEHVDDLRHITPLAQINLGKFATSMYDKYLGWTKKFRGNQLSDMQILVRNLTESELSQIDKIAHFTPTITDRHPANADLKKALLTNELKTSLAEARNELKTSLAEADIRHQLENNPDTYSIDPLCPDEILNILRKIYRESNQLINSSANEEEEKEKGYFLQKTITRALNRGLDQLEADTPDKYLEGLERLHKAGFGELIPALPRRKPSETPLPPSPPDSDSDSSRTPLSRTRTSPIENIPRSPYTDLDLSRVPLSRRLEPVEAQENEWPIVATNETKTPAEPLNVPEFQPPAGKGIEEYMEDLPTDFANKLKERIMDASGWATKAYLVGQVNNLKKLIPDLTSLQIEMVKTKELFLINRQNLGTDYDQKFADVIKLEHALVNKLDDLLQNVEQHVDSKPNAKNLIETLIPNIINEGREITNKYTEVKNSVSTELRKRSYKTSRPPSTSSFGSDTPEPPPSRRPESIPTPNDDELLAGLDSIEPPSEPGRGDSGRPSFKPESIMNSTPSKPKKEPKQSIFKRGGTLKKLAGAAGVTATVGGLGWMVNETYDQFKASDEQLKKLSEPKKPETPDAGYYNPDANVYITQNPDASAEDASEPIISPTSSEVESTETSSTTKSSTTAETAPEATPEVLTPLGRQFYEMNREEVSQELKRIQAENSHNPSFEHLKAVTDLMLGTPYGARPEDEGRGNPAEHPLNLDKLNCFTMIEDALAMAWAKDFKEAVSALNVIRYKGGKAEYAKRFHIPEEWLKNMIAQSRLTDDTRNQANFHNVETGLATVKYTAESWPEQTKVLSDPSLPFSASPGERLSIPYIKIEDALKVANKLGEGYIISVVRQSDSEGKAITSVSHMGVLVIGPGEKLYVRHATSSKRLGKKVVDEPIADFLARQTRLNGRPVVGINLAKPL